MTRLILKTNIQIGVVPFRLVTLEDSVLTCSRGTAFAQNTGSWEPLCVVSEIVALTEQALKGAGKSPWKTR